MGEVGPEVSEVSEDELLRLPLPVALLSGTEEHLPAGATAVVEALAAITPGASARDTLAALDPFARAILERWRATEVVSDRLSPPQAEYDRYFRVARVDTGSPLTAFYDVTIVAYHRLLGESLAEHTLRPVELGHLRGAFEGVLFRLRAPDRPVAARCARPGITQVAPPAARTDALRRWIRGHHAFFVMIQALLLAHERLGRAMRAGDPARIQAMLDWAIDLWWAAGAAFRLAGDFDPHSYATIVRPSMSPPHVSEGFSGLNSPDHMELMAMLKATRSAIDDRCLTHPAEHRAYLWALSSVYDSHVYVCEEFVGDGPSLRGTTARHAPNATAVLGGPLKQRAMSHAGAPSFTDE